MPLTAITIENFKGIREPVRVEFKPITLLFGPNSAGKSTVVQALHYAREIFERQNLNPDRTLLGGDSIDLGGFEALVHRHDKSLPIIMRFDMDLEVEDLPHYLEGYEDFSESRWQESDLWDVPAKVKSAWVEIAISWSMLRGRPLLKSYTVGANGVELALIEMSDDGRQIAISKLNPFHPVFPQDETSEEAGATIDAMDDGYEVREDHEADEIDLKRLIKTHPFLSVYLSAVDLSDGKLPGLMTPLDVSGQSSALPAWGKPLQIDRSFFSEDLDFETEGHFVQTLSSLVVGPGELVRDALRKFCYLGPLRVVPPRNFLPARTPDESRWSNGMAAWDTMINEDENFLNKLNDWLSNKDRLNSGYKVMVKDFKEMDLSDPVSLSIIQGSVLDDETTVSQYVLSLPTRRRLLFWEEANGIEVQPLDIGVGISQVLPVIAAALSARSGFVAIEQPELHIHPAFQVTLGDLFNEQIKEYPDLVFLIETHSEHLLLRLLRRIRETHSNELPPGIKSLDPGEIAIYYVENSRDGVRLSELRVSEDGDSLGAWPKGFFEERHGELY